MERSSTCSTSKPINQAPNDTSSFAYRCNMGLTQKKEKKDEVWMQLVNIRRKGKGLVNSWNVTYKLSEM